MTSVAWKRLIERFGGVEGARAYSREKKRLRRLDPKARARDAEVRRLAARGKRKPLRSSLCLRARRRGRQAGLEATIRATDIVWPEFCPVLGLRLDYETPRGRRPARSDALPTLDRWDNSKGYIPGNVFVISWRANSLKSNASPEELEAVARYARHGLDIR